MRVMSWLNADLTAECGVLRIHELAHASGVPQTEQDLIVQYLR